MKRCALAFVILAVASGAALARGPVPDCVPSTDPKVPPCNLKQEPITPGRTDYEKTSFIDKHPNPKGRGGKNTKQRDRVVVYNKGKR